MFETALDRRIFKTVRQHTCEHPQTLVGIIAGVDAAERLVLTYEELSGGIQRLLASGLIAEAAPLFYYECQGVSVPQGSSGLTMADHSAAVAEYRKWFARAMESIEKQEFDDDGFVWRKLVLRWATPDGRFPTDEDEDGAEALAELIDPIIGPSGLGEINGFEFGAGQIDVLIFGKATDADVDGIYDLVAPAFRKFDCPVGSRIVRVYNESGHEAEVESDIVT
ncbi:MAG: hypothetical protein KDA58_17110 [Planctomycetaceae bacterium]|nr:hypothetical protein [Planctomycetaceae bacterium]